MKKILSLLLVSLMLLSLCACGGKKAETKNPGVFSVGFGRASIQPTASIQLGGYGNTNERMSQSALDYLYATCVAVKDANGEIVLLYTMDLIRSITSWMPDLRAAITEATGVPGEKIMIAATHTHSGPDVGGAVTQSHIYYTQVLKPGLVEAGKAAMKDLAPATVKAGTTNVVGMNFVRHYKQENGMYYGDNYGSKAASPTVGFATEADQEMQLIQFVREGDKKDVLLVNWQAHPKVASNGNSPFGRANRPQISADYVGWCRMHVEKNADVLFAYYLGASGNLNPRDAYTYKNDEAPENVDQYGEKLGGYVLDAMQTLTDVSTPTIASKQVQFQGEAITGEVREMEINAILMGQFSFVTVPYEMFDTNAMEVKDGSPTDITFVLTCANGRFGYMPAEYVWEYKTADGSRPYEETQCQFAPGTGEKVAQELVGMLNALAGK